MSSRCTKCLTQRKFWLTRHTRTDTVMVTQTVVTCWHFSGNLPFPGPWSWETNFLMSLSYSVIFGTNCLIFLFLKFFFCSVCWWRIFNRSSFRIKLNQSAPIIIASASIRINQQNFIYCLKSQKVAWTPSGGRAPVRAVGAEKTARGTMVRSDACNSWCYGSQH